MHHASAGGHIDACGLWCHWRPCWHPWPWSMLQPEAIWLSVVCILTGGHVDVCGLWYHQRPWRYPKSLFLPEAILKPVGHITTRGHVMSIVHVVVQAFLMLMVCTPVGDRVVHTAIKVYVNVFGLCCCLNPWWCLWPLSMHHLKDFWMSTVCAPSCTRSCWWPVTSWHYLDVYAVLKCSVEVCHLHCHWRLC